MIARLLSPARRTAWGLGTALALLLSSVALAPTATAQGVDDKRAEAEEVASELEQLRIQASQLDERYGRALEGLEGAQQDILDTEARVAEVESTFAEHRAELEAYAVEAYMGGDDVESIDTLLQSTGPNEVPTRGAYLRAASGDRRDLLDRLAAAQADLDVELSHLQEAEAEAQQLSDEARTALQGAQRSVDEEAALLARVEGELADLVVEEEARRAAEARRRAEEQVRREAEQADEAPPPAAPSPDVTTPPPTVAAAEAPTGTSGAPAPTTTSPPAPEPPPAAVAPPSAGGPPAGAGQAVSLAYSLVGTPYVWGGSSPSTGFDCSGFTSYVWAQAGYGLPRTAASQAAATIPIPYAELQPGDLVFYGWGYIHHVALYVGGGQIVHAPGSGKSVRVDSLYYWDQMHGAGRLP